MGPKGMLAPLSNYWGGGPPPPPAPLLFLRLWICVSLGSAVGKHIHYSYKGQASHTPQHTHTQIEKYLLLPSHRSSQYLFQSECTLPFHKSFRCYTDLLSHCIIVHPAIKLVSLLRAERQIKVYIGHEQ